MSAVTDIEVKDGVDQETVDAEDLQELLMRRDVRVAEYV